ncbi:MAG TPA: dTDP-4-dehydrorhamnose 3,5-epimerase [Flavisolibacter sp.]|jgi:dTDP-4-dehydrorhamnose 3,5-epimerase
MPFETTPIPGLLVFMPKVFEDSRGYFFESYNEQVFREQGIDTRFVQDNQSQSVYGVIRGLHYQKSPHAQCKLVRVLEGEILDVAVDIRKGSPTYGQHISLVLSAENKQQLFIPEGFAHGFSVLSPRAAVLYKCNRFYNKESEGGILFNDPELGIDWQVPVDAQLISDKDQVLPPFASHQSNFEYTDDGSRT